MAPLRSVDVCVATFKRPALLEELLASLAEQDLHGIRARIVVVDNDPDASGRAAVEEFAARSALEVIYDIEPSSGVAAVRTRALRHVESEYLAFIDDDERVSPTWLRTLLDTCERHQADAVFGPVIAILPPDAPTWAAQHSVFKCSTLPTGTVVPHGATNNTLVRTAALGNPCQEFNPAFGQTGGEDIEFFYRLHLAGRRLVWCAEAIVWETVPPSRARLDWILRRSYRSGQCVFRIFVTRYTPAAKALWLVRKTAVLLLAVAAIPFARLLSYRLFVELLSGVYRAAGQLSGCFTTSFVAEYGRTSC